LPLPITEQAWPPPALEPIRAKQSEHAAWYSNQVDQLASHYSGAPKARGGLVQRVARWFWSSGTDLTQPERKLHVPVASDLCQASSDLLFSEPPSFTVEDEKSQERLDEIIDPVAHQVLASSGEVNAALGDVYLRATWDKSVVPDKPFLAKIDADMASPEFTFGRLTAVTFWTVLGSNTNGLVTRHLERHETNAEGIGIVEHGLYQGTKEQLGRRIPLTEHPATRFLPVDADSTISTLSPGLDVVHVPNVQPNRMFRNHPIGVNLGRSDLDGIEPTLDALDEAYSSLMRDIRLGRSMLVVSEQMLTSNGPGGGSTFNQSEVFTPVKAPPSAMADQKPLIEAVQFKIRIEEHERAVALLWNTIVRSAGYSAQTFGEGGDVTITATEVASKERRSYLTRDRKIRSFKPALEALCQKLLAIDAAVFNSGANGALPVDVSFADGVQDDPEALARTAQLLAASLSASIETRVRLQHKDWDEPAIMAEVAQIRAENNLTALADPDTLGEDGQGLGDAFPN
jgi:A118 family predicted phage portal protein